MDFDRLALVVGAGSGIGREVAFTLASRGVSTLVCAGINLEAARETSLMSNSRKSEHSGGYKVHALEVDTRDEMSVQRMVDETKSLFGRIDHFVSTAGVGASGQKEISSMILQDYRSMDEVHNIGGFLCVQKTLQIMLQQEPRPMPAAGRPTGPSPRHMSRGSIVILTSFASEGAFLGVRNYISAKHAVKEPVQTAGKRVHNILPNDCEDRRTRQRIQIALENARKLIRINAVAPSYVSGPMINKYLEEVPALKTTMLGDLAIGRFVDPEEVADAVAFFLTSASASYINGYTLTVDGGSSLHLANTPFRMNN